MELPQGRLVSKSLRRPERVGLNPGQTFSVVYHDLFSYALSSKNMKIWESSLKSNKKGVEVDSTFYRNNRYFFLKGRENLVNKTGLREKIAIHKETLALYATQKISFIPTLLGVGITGALAMKNADSDSDIDLILITKRQTLWATRILVRFIFLVNSIGVRRPGDLNQKDKLCLNIWLDEESLIWSAKDRNIYTAHEILQIKPLLNKKNIFGRFFKLNRWALGYWPYAKRVFLTSAETGNGKLIKRVIIALARVVNKPLYLLQLLYMSKKRSREDVTIRKALFHPVNWGKVVLKKVFS